MSIDFKDKIKQLSERVQNLKESIHTEEATKNALIMPFIQALGYDVFDPHEVVPEFISDIGTKKGEKIDYAICSKGVPTILIECKHWKQNLTLHDNQLLRYFHVSKAKFGVLTNGINYKFYTDLVEPNKMDEKPFLEIKLSEIKENQIEELKKFHKSYFNIENIIESASELKYLSELRSIIVEELGNPSPDFTRFFARQVYPGVVTQKVLEQFQLFLKKSFTQHINEQFTDKLQTALKNEENAVIEEEAEARNDTDSSQEKIVKSAVDTTQDELDVFYMIKAILSEHIEIDRITYRDAQSYFAVFVDNNNRKPICRLYFNTSNKYIGFIDEKKTENKVQIEKLSDIYKHKEFLKNAVLNYL